MCYNYIYTLNVELSERDTIYKCTSMGPGGGEREREINNPQRLRTHLMALGNRECGSTCFTRKCACQVR